MKKSEFISATAKKAELTQKEMERALDAMCEVITEECIEKGEEVSFSIGKFKRKVNQARTGTNPLTQKPLDVPESHTIAFKPSKTIKKVIEATPAKKGKKK